MTVGLLGSEQKAEVKFGLWGLHRTLRRFQSCPETQACGLISRLLHGPWAGSEAGPGFLVLI